MKLSDLNAAGKDDFVAALGNIFEYSPWIAEEAAASRPFSGVAALFAAMKAVVDRATAETRLALIRAHPDLANKTQRAAGLTAESNHEQNSVGLDRLSDAEFQAFEPTYAPSRRPVQSAREHIRRPARGPHCRMVRQQRHHHVVAMQRSMRTLVWDRLVARAEVPPRCRRHDEVPRPRRSRECHDLDDPVWIRTVERRVEHRVGLSLHIAPYT